MYCKYCGNSIDDNAVVCPHCQHATGRAVVSTKDQGTNTVAIVGFVFSFLFALVGLICSIVGYRKADNYANGGNKGLALAGIIISAVSMGLAFLIAFI